MERGSRQVTGDSLAAVHLHAMAGLALGSPWAPKSTNSRFQFLASSCRVQARSGRIWVETVNAHPGFDSGQGQGCKI
jgi:hypothetical protein